MNNKIWSSLLVIFLGISIMLNVIILLRFNNITEDVNRNFSKLNYLERNIGELSSDLEEIRAKQDWVSSKDYSILKVDEDYKNATILLHGSLKELDNDSNVYLLYGKINEKSPEDIEWNKVPLQISYGLKFAKKIKLPYKENYKFKILAQGSTRTISEDLFYIYFKDEMKNRISTLIFESGSSKDKHNTILDINIDNNYKGNEKFKVKSIKLNVYTDNKIVKTVSIYENGKVIEDDNISEIPTSDNNGLMSKDDGNNERLYYNVVIKNDFNKNSSTKYEVVIQDYFGEEYKEEYLGEE